jgi:hypothetical protein
MHDHARRTASDSVSDKAMAIEAFTLEGDKNRSRFNLAGISDHRAKAQPVSRAR